jgi:3-oxoacyl-[acyl-carrier protein] reductase
VTGGVPPGAQSDLPARVALRVTADMVARFAALTGDRSSLHMSPAFARRSAYRRTVVHGMLPVAFLPLLVPSRRPGLCAVPIALQARFMAPVHADDALTLMSEPGREEPDGRGVVFAFRIERDASRATVTEGAMTVEYRQAAPRRAGPTVSAQGGLVQAALEVNDVPLERIDKGMTDRVDFHVSEAAVREFVNLLGDGVGEDGREHLDGLAERFHVPNLLSMLLFSTSVGTSLPGASATFLEFSARIERDVELDAAYCLEGEVRHRSVGTRIVKKDLVVRHADGSDGFLLRGRAAIFVAPPAPRMPTMAELRELAVDPGLRDKVVLVTGASRGIGETTAKLFALAGARVVVNYRQGAEDAERVVREIVDGGGDAVAVGGDVTQADEVRRLVGAAVERYGAIHVLINNAARNFRPIPFLTLTWEEIQQDLDVIAKGAFLCCQQVIPLMLRQGGGKIVNISSVATDDPPPDQTKYVMAKSALVGLTRSLAVELAPRNIQVNLVVPNFVETDLVAHVPEGFRRQIARETPMQRLASVVDVAQAVVFLASSHASFTSGQKLMVTGGGAPYL